MHSDLQQLKREINQIVILVQVHSRSSFYGTTTRNLNFILTMNIKI